MATFEAQGHGWILSLGKEGGSRFRANAHSCDETVLSREGRFGLGREKQDEDQGFGGEHAEGGLLSVPVP